MQKLIKKHLYKINHLLIKNNNIIGGKSEKYTWNTNFSNIYGLQ